MTRGLWAAAVLWMSGCASTLPTGQVQVGEPRVERPEVCIQIYQPVCGVDGRTYPNSCHAQVAGVDLACEGECPCGPSATYGSTE